MKDAMNGKICLVTGVTVNALHPGFVATGFAKNNGKVIAALVSIFALLVARSLAKGAETSIYLAVSPSVEGITGQYFYDSQVIPPAPQATDMVVAGQLSDVSAAMVQLADGLPAMPSRRQMATVQTGENSARE